MLILSRKLGESIVIDGRIHVTIVRVEGEVVKRAVDWRVQFEERPMSMIGLAFGGGVLLSTLIGGRSRSRRTKPVDKQGNASWDPRADRADFGTNGSAAYNTSEPSESWRNIKVA